MAEFYHMRQTGPDGHLLPLASLSTVPAVWLLDRLDDTEAARQAIGAEMSTAPDRKLLWNERIGGLAGGAHAMAFEDQVPSPGDGPPQLGQAGMQADIDQPSVSLSGQRACGGFFAKNGH